MPHDNTEDDDESLSSSPIFTEEQEKLYTKGFDEGFDIKDPNYEAWIKINHPFKSLSVTSADSISNVSAFVNLSTESSEQFEINNSLRTKLFLCIFNKK